MKPVQRLTRFDLAHREGYAEIRTLTNRSDHCKGGYARRTRPAYRGVRDAPEVRGATVLPPGGWLDADEALSLPDCLGAVDSDRLLPLLSPVASR